MSNGISSWESRADEKRRRILSQVPGAFLHLELTHTLEDPASVQAVPSKYLSDEEYEITGLDAVALVSAIAKRTYTSVQVLNAFTHRAAIAHRLLNCCLDFPYEASLARAEELDRILEQTGETVGPLHGLPISVKDQCRLIGTETTCGFIHPLGKLDIDDSVIVKILKDAGAVIFAKTSLSIGCMWGETVNNILGRACNPFNRTFSCGGSSGGEGALVGFHGSPMGIGSDLGGSIRSPSAYQGLFGLRPTSGRIPYYRMLNSMEARTRYPPSSGPWQHQQKLSSSSPKPS
jgi:amidase